MKKSVAHYSFSAPQIPKKLLNKKEMAALIGLKPATLVKMAQQRTIPHYKPGYKTLLFDPDEVMAWLTRKHVPANPLRVDN